MDEIRFNQTRIEGNELLYIREAIETGKTSPSGPFSQRASEIIREWHEAAGVLLTTSCTDALELAALMLDLEPGDRVIVPSFTFVSSALAFVRERADIVFADIEPSTLGLDPKSVASLIDERTKAIVPVHYAGIGGQIADLSAVVPDHVEIVEDNAHGFFGEADGQKLGTFGRFSALSFQETKNFVCGEGGALIINRESDVDRAHTMYDKGTNRRQFFLGQVDRYNWRDTGSSFGLSDVLAAYLFAQLEQKDQILAARRRIFEFYMAALKPMVTEFGLTLPTVPEGAVPAYHLFYFLTPTTDIRGPVLEKLKSMGIGATFHYVPLHSAPAASRFSSRAYDCPVTDDVSARLIRLPFHNGLTDSELERVVESLDIAMRSQ